VDVPATARVVTDPNQRRPLIEAAARRWGRTDVPDMLRHSPLIVPPRLHAKRTWVWFGRSTAVDTHAGGFGCLDTEGAVFDHHAPSGRSDHGAGGLQE
jgi:hypothetical protein